MILLTLQSGLRVLYHEKDIHAVMEYEHKGEDDRSEVNSIVTVNLWVAGSSNPVPQNILVKESIEDIHNALDNLIC